MGPRRGACLAAALAGAALAAGCSRQDESSIPVACTEGPEPIRAALARAPAEVRLDGGTRLSSCFARASDPADVQTIGASLISVAEDLAAEARRQPEGAGARRLGYLIGAVRRGAGRTQGIHDELVRRLDQELTVVDTGSAAFRQGEAAGRESG